MVPVSVSISAASHQIEAAVSTVSVCPNSNLLSDLKDESLWTTHSDGMDSVVEDPNILLHNYQLPSDDCRALVDGIVAGTASIVIDGSFNPESSMGPTGTSAIVLAPSTECPDKFYAKGNNWVTGSGAHQSAYRSEIAGVISALTMSYVLVLHYKITDGAVTIALNGDSALIQSGGDWPLSVAQADFDYLQVIRAWIELSPLKFNFCYVKGHQTDHIRYDQLDWWGQRNEDVDTSAKSFLHHCTTVPVATRQVYAQPTLYLEK